MKDTKKCYRLSVASTKDVNDIYDYTLLKFGEQQTVKYLNGLEERLDFLGNYPASGRSREEVRKGLMSFAYRRHVIFYRVMKYGIKVVRILHASMDIPKQFGTP
ncbi:type II toxin-antitoxin system RelE/ParE family toxin [Parapedobacter sp. GCM10030251]|uniref:type II toxin-antitoxin system RelE/ParE family toxin n=1 Tax=Parapedobacter sp. GCM10030251 TaxID=3273419 RepID=UPI0036152A93